MPFDEDAEEDVREFRPPPDPDDRLWRHPSEIGAHPLVETGVPSRGRPWGVVLVAGATGAALAGAGVLALGVGERVVDRPVVSQVALNPVASLPPSGATAAGDGVRDRVGPAVVALTADGRGATPGSGVVVRDDGIVLTGAGVLGDSKPGTPVDARLGDASSVTGNVVGTDPSTGIGVVDLAGEGYQTAVLAPAAGLDAGDVGFATGATEVGEPRGDAAVVGITFGTARRQAATPTGVLDGAVTAAVASDPDEVPGGLLGGPLLDGRGAVVGVTASHRSTTILATPVEVARRVVDDLLTTGRADHCWLGIEGRDVLASTGDPGGTPGGTPIVPAGTKSTPGGPTTTTRDADRGGALVVSVVPAGPAHRAGLRADDVITAFDGRRIEGMADLILALRARRPGDRAQLSVVREGAASQATVRLGSLPQAAG